MSTPQERLARAAIRIGRSFGIGGSSWTQRRTSGNGISADKTVSTVGTITGYVLHDLPSELAIALAGATVPKGSWWYVTQAAVLVSDSIQSSATSSLVYTLETADGVGDVYLCRLSVGGVTT